MGGGQKRYKVYAPEEVRQLIHTDAIIIICVNSKDFEADIQDTIRKIGITNQIMIL